jgi:Phage integrase family
LLVSRDNAGEHAQQGIFSGEAKMNVFQLADLFYGYMATRNTPGTIGYYKRHIERFKVHVGALAVTELRKHHLMTWGTTWHAMQAVQRLFTWAHQDAELIERNPFKGMRRPRLGGRRRVLTRVEIAKLLRGSRADFRAFLLAMRETIARPQEIKAVRWDQIRWEGEHTDRAAALVAGAAYFELWEYKSRERRADPSVPRVILINARLGRLLARKLRKQISVTYRVFNTAAMSAWTTNSIRLRVRRLCRRLGLVADGRGEPIVAYSFRHTSATNACANGMPDRVLAEIMGHTSTRTTARYQHPSHKHLRDAINRLTPRLR